MVARSLSFVEIHRIVPDAPDDGDDSSQSWEEESVEEISDPDEAEDVENQELAGNSGYEQRPSTYEICEQTQNRNEQGRTG